MRRISFPLALTFLALSLGTVACWAETGQILGTVMGARSGIPVSVHPVTLLQGRDVLARSLTDRLGKFKLDFSYTPGTPLQIKTGSTTGYLPAEGVVDPNTEVAIKVMPRWATIIGIVTDRDTVRGLADIPVQAGRGEELLSDNWALVKTDPTGVFMMKVPAFDGDDVTNVVRDLWLSVNETEASSEKHAVIHTDTVSLWAWPDPTQPTKVEVSLPMANATGLTIADVVSIKVPDALKNAVQPTVATPETPDTNVPATVAATTAEGTLQAGEFIWTCPKTGQRYKITIVPID